MILEKLVVLAAIIVSYFLQINDLFRLGDIKPDFLLILAIYFAVYKGEFWGIWVGFFGGLLQDINLGGISVQDSGQVEYFIGTNALPKTLMGYFAGKFAKGVKNDTTLVIAIMVLVLSLMKGFVTFFTVAIFHGGAAGQIIITRILPEAFYNAILGIFWFRLLKWALPFDDATTGYSSSYT